MPKIKSRRESTQALLNLVIAAIFCSLAYVAMLTTSWIKVAFLTCDAKDAVITIAGLLLGPVYSLVISFIVAFIELITVGDTGIYGFIMNFVSSAAFSVTCALIYKYKKNIKGAIIALVSSVLSMTVIMILFNLFVTPIYMGATMGDVAKMIPTLLLPFNLTKATMNAAIVLVLYKPVSKVLKSAGLLSSSNKNADAGDADKAKKRENLKFSIVITTVGLLLIAVCIAVFVLVLHGSISFS